MEAIRKEIEAIDETIKELNRNNVIVGELDQKGDLIIGEKETWGEAVERKKQADMLLTKKGQLEVFLQKAEHES